MTDPAAKPDRQPSTLRRLAPHLVWVLLLAALVAAQWRVFFDAGEPPDDGVAWREDPAKAFAEADRTGRPVLAYFTADWCPPCQVMKRSAWPDPRVAPAIQAGYVPLRLDVDQPDAAALAQHYLVSAIPTVMILDADGVPQRAANYLDADELAAFLTEAPAAPRG